jgi:alkylation response protein AidB-like acyl-CoA dehydrogenase
MDLELTPDQRELRDVARQALDARAPLSLARAFLEGRAVEPLHPLLTELGWYAVGVDPDDGFGIPGLALLAQQVGAHAAPTALVDTAVAARLYPALAEGDRTVALAVLEAEGDWSLSDLGMSLVAREDVGWRLYGHKLGVQHATSADLLLVVAECGGTPACALVPAGAPGLSIRPQAGVDAASAPAVVELSGVTVADEDVLTGPDALAALEAAFAVGAVATAAEGLGAAAAALDLAIEYAGERHQFGRPIGSFQALKHVMADAHIDRESAWSSVLYASAALDEGLDSAGETASIAAGYAARASRRVVEAALQVFGGIAFTWEHDAHLLQRRVLSCERRFGDALFHESRLGAALASRRVAVTA